MPGVVRHVIVVGGGIAGLASAIYLARGGCSVTLFEKNQHLGGRAVTHTRHGFRFNLGPHAVYRHGPGAAVYRELGIPIRGGTPRRGGLALLDGEQHRLPVTPLSILFTSALSMRGRVEALSLVFRLAAMNTRRFDLTTIHEWADRHIADARLREVFLALCRVVTYSGNEKQSAAVALEQLKLGMRGVVYVHEGWQRIVDSLHGAAVAAGVNFVTSARVVGVDADHAVRGVALGGLEPEMPTGTLEVALPPRPVAEEPGAARVPADTVVLAVDPATAADLISDANIAASWRALQPVTIACLDLGLSRLPEPKTTFAIGVDRPYYYSVHSQWADLAPRGGALVHVAKYRSKPAPLSHADYDGETIQLSDESRRDEAELEALLDELQPGWRELVVHRRFLPSIAVTHSMASPCAYRPAAVTPIRGLYVAGDWVGCEGILADAALSSARAATRAILADA